jgi:hypothetical protein
MMKKFGILAAVGVSFVLLGGLIAFAQDKGEKKGKENKEREIKEAEVPPAVLATIKKLAGANKIDKYEEEIEHGHKVYEAAYTTPEGKRELVVLENGELAAMEEAVPADKVPAAVKAAAEKEAGKDGKVTFEKKTVIMYEAKIMIGDKKHEINFMPDGTKHGKHGKDKDKENDEDDDD